MVLGRSLFGYKLLVALELGALGTDNLRFLGPNDRVMHGFWAVWRLRETVQQSLGKLAWGDLRQL